MRGKFLPSLRRPERKAAVDRRHSAGPNYAFTGTPYTPLTDIDLDRTIRDQYERDVWVWRAVDARAKTAGGIDVVIRDGRGDKAKPIEGHPLAELLNGKPNPYESAFSLRYRLMALLDLSVTKGCFMEVQEARGGIITRADILNPMHTWPVPDPDTFVERFEMRLPNGDVFEELAPYRPGKGGVLWFKRPHPVDPYQSTSWLRAAGLSIDLDYWARRYNLNFLFNDGRPGGVLAVQSGDDDDDGGIDEQTAATLQERMSGGPNAAGRVTILEANHLEYIDLSQSPREAQYVEGRTITQREILVAAGTPLSVIGDASGRTFDNADAEGENFWRKEMRPELRMQANTWDETTAGGLADTTEVVDYDWDSVEELQRERRRRESAALADAQAGYRSVDEYRAVLGLDPLDVPGSRVLWVAQGKAPIGSDADVVALLTQGQQPQALGAGAAAPQLTVGADPNATETIDAQLIDPLDEAGYGQKVLRAVPKDLAARRRREHGELIDRWTAQVGDEIRALLRRQEAVILTRLRGTKARRHTRHWTYSVPRTDLKSLDPAYVVERRGWIDEAVRVLAGVVLAAFAAAGKAVAEQLDADTLEPGEDAAAAVARTVRLIAEGLDARAGRLQEIIAAADEAGDTVAEIAAKVSDAFTSADTWADVNSRTVVGAMNAAGLLQAVHAGALAKRWLATEDERTRPTHRKAEGQVVPIGSQFKVGAASLEFPGDPTGDLAEIINCRCTMLFALGPPDHAGTLDADLAELDKAEAEWKAFRAIHAAEVVFDAAAHPRDYRGRFLDVPDVTLPDGTHGSAVATDRAGRIVVALDDGGTRVVRAHDLTPRAVAPAGPGAPAHDLTLPVEDNPDVTLPKYLLSYLKTVIGGALHPVEHGSPDEHIALQQMEAMFRRPGETAQPWQLVRTPDGKYGQVASARVDGMVDVVGLPDGKTGRYPLLDLKVAGPPPYITSYDSYAERHVTCSQGHRHWGASGAAGVLVRNVDRAGEPRYLLQLRSPGVQHGGTWSTPGGALHIGERPEEGGMREAVEELGALPDGVSAADVFTDEHGGWAYHTVVLDSPTRFATEEGDREGIRTGWFTASEVDRLNLHPSFRESWPTLRDRLGGGKSNDRSPHPEHAGGRVTALTFSDQLDEPMAATAAVRADLEKRRGKPKPGEPAKRVPVGDMNMALAAMLARAGIAYDPTAEPSLLAGEHAAKPGETGDGAKARAMIPSLEELIDTGMSTDEAAKEWRRLYNNARFRVRDARLKALKNATDKVAEDKAAPAVPKIPAEVLSGDDIDAIVDTIDQRILDDLADPGSGVPKALYTLDVEQLSGLAQTGAPMGPGALAPQQRWHSRTAGMADGQTIPVVHLWHQGHLIEHGTVYKLAGAPPVLIEHGPDEYAGVIGDAGTVTHPAAQRAKILADRWSRATANVKPSLQGLQKGLAWLTADNPADPHWAQTYGIEHFKSAATGGDGSMTFWDVTPTVGTIAHEFGHNIDTAAPMSGITGRLTDPSAIPDLPGDADAGALPANTSWNLVRADDGVSAQMWSGFLSFAGTEFVEARHAPGDHVIMLGNTETDAEDEIGTPTDYGRASVREDFAESVRLYLKDRSLGRLGYLTPTGGETSGPVLRFADMYPERARYLDGVFGNAPLEDTPWRQRQRAAARDALIATAKNAEDWADPDGDPTAEWPDTADLEASYAISYDDIDAAKQEALGQLVTEIEAEKKKQAAAQQAAAAALAAQQKKAAELKAKADAATAAILAHLDEVIDTPAPDPLDPDAVKKIKKRKAWVKWNAQQDKVTPFPATGEGGGYAKDDLVAKDGKGKLLAQPGGKTMVEYGFRSTDGEPEHADTQATVRALTVSAGTDESGPYIVMHLVATRDATGQWSDLPNGGGSRVYLDRVAPGTLARVDKVGMSKAQAQLIADNYETEALAAHGTGLAAAKGLPGAPVPEVAGLTDKQVGAIIVGASDAYDHALTAAITRQVTPAQVMLDGLSDGDPGGAVEAALLGKTILDGPWDPGHGEHTLTDVELSDAGDGLVLTFTPTSSLYEPVVIDAEQAGTLLVLDKGTPEDASAARADYIVNAVIQALADPASGANHGAPSEGGWPTKNAGGKATKWLHAKGGQVHPHAQTQGHPETQAKANIAAELADRLNNEDDWESFRQYRAAIKSGTGDKYGSVPFDVGSWADTTPAQRQLILDQECSNRVGNWASTSGDNSPWSVAMQRAVAEEFATGGDWNPHGMSMSYELGNGVTVGAAYDAGMGAFYRRFVRVMWENTQAEFAEAGVTKVSLTRGMKGGNAKQGQWTVPGTHEVTDLMPANSWSSRASTAKAFGGGNFSGRLLVATFPVDRILGSARSGFGCWGEYEFVVINGPGNITVYSGGPNAGSDMTSTE